MKLYGAIEGGGTKFNCAVSDGNLKIIESITVPTTTPTDTLQKIFHFFDSFDELCSIGVGSFGPIGIDKSKKNYGYILDTPKVGWQDYRLLGVLKEHYPVPIAWTTDVNAAAYGEFQLGAAKGKNSCVYLTIGTGIGGGIIIDGKIYEGFSHPEMGHIKINHRKDDIFDGICHFHHDCLEGLASGPSLEARTGKKGIEIEENHSVWEFEADYIAQALMNYTLILAPEIIILGGGVMNQSHLLEKIKKSFFHQMAGYINIDNLDNYIVDWELSNKSGILGCLCLAKEIIG